MSSRLEQFINDHREEFDSEEPSKKIWDKIQDKMDPKPVVDAPKVVSFSVTRWAAAAAVVISCGHRYLVFQPSCRFFNGKQYGCQYKGSRYQPRQ